MADPWHEERAQREREPAAGVPYQGRTAGGVDEEAGGHGAVVDEVVQAGEHWRGPSPWEEECSGSEEERVAAAGGPRGSEQRPRRKAFSASSGGQLVHHS